MRCSPAQFSAERNSSLYPFPGRFIPRGENRRWLFPLICQSALSGGIYAYVYLSKNGTKQGCSYFRADGYCAIPFDTKRIVLQEHDSSVYRNEDGRYHSSCACHCRNQLVYIYYFYLIRKDSQIKKMLQTIVLMQKIFGEI